VGKGEGVRDWHERFAVDGTGAGNPDWPRRLPMATGMAMATGVGDGADWS